MDHPPAPADKTVQGLLGDLRVLIQNARGRVAHAVNAGLVALYWNIGRRIRTEILHDRRAVYGETIFQTLSEKLTGEYGSGFGNKNLRHMVRFAEVFPDDRIVSALRRQLTWTHFKSIIYIDDPLKRDFYAELCRIERWSTRTLDAKVAGMLFERTAISKKPAKLAALELKALREEDRLTPDLVFRDPYLLDFLGLKGAYQEKDLEAAILREMESFLLELGTGFSFVARQKRISTGAKERVLDLLFYNRKWRRLLAVELKLGDFEPEHKGQMEFYLRWLNKHERELGEASPRGLILCAGADHEEVELLELGKSGIMVAQYLTVLPPREILERKLRQAVEAARARLAR